MSHRAIAQACAIGVGTVSLYLQRSVHQGLGWPLPAELDDAGLKTRLFRRAAPAHDRVRPDCAYIQPRAQARRRAASTACARSEVTWLRDRLLKLGVHAVRSVRRVVLHLPRSPPHPSIAHGRPLNPVDACGRRVS